MSATLTLKESCFVTPELPKVSSLSVIEMLKLYNYHAYGGRKEKWLELTLRVRIRFTYSALDPACPHRQGGSIVQKCYLAIKSTANSASQRLTGP